MFAKLFETERHGQILIMFDSGDKDQPFVEAMIKPKGLGICKYGPSWDNTDEGWELAEEFFKGIDQRVAEKMADALLELIS